ncbi:MFS general substrate transporter [Hortaea werneckii]|nr:MFS general substrate transporter [Hortaea werneckii]KAI6994037.1 MFS general substrate transporter [Hortaea werneckii]KAI7145838.1 MFS general substrate transporter [Hortaea werneckii]KAI7174742.1 MFS general substrate transporter [Hortaea werneckii]
MADNKEQAADTQDFAADQSKQSLDSSQVQSAHDIELGPRATQLNTGSAAGISQEHRDYLLQRHGTLDLDPLPSEDPADPYNWPQWKKMANLICVGFHATMTTFIAAAIIPTYEDVAEDLGVSIQRASYLTSLQIAILGWAPLFWKPIANRYGRRPVWLISTMGALLFNVGCALSNTYTAVGVCRAFCAFFISPAIAIGSGVVTETFFKKERAKYMGVWTLLVTLGPPSGPFFMGFVGYHTGDYHWIYWILAIVNGVQFIAYIFFGPETRYLRQGVVHKGSAFKQEYLTLRRIDPAPFNAYEFISPLALARYTSVVIPSVTYAIVFAFTSVLITVEIPQLSVPKFEFNPQQIGLQFLGNIIGSVLGEQIAGRGSDWWMNWKTKQMNGGASGDKRPEPEFRLWLSYGGYLLSMVGLLVFGIRFQQAPQGEWNVTPIVGVAIAAAGGQVITTVLVTYAVDCHTEHSASIGAFVNVVRQTWAFIGPFWFPDMLETVGGSGSGGIMAGLIFVCAWLPTAFLQWRGQNWRQTKSHVSGKEGQGRSEIR